MLVDSPLPAAAPGPDRASSPTETNAAGSHPRARDSAGGLVATPPAPAMAAAGGAFEPCKAQQPPATRAAMGEGRKGKYAPVRELARGLRPHSCWTCVSSRARK